MLNLRFTAGVGVGISGACELPLAWRAHKPLPWALRSSAALAIGRATLLALATELVVWHRASASALKGCGLLFSFQSLFYLLVSFCACLVALKLRSLRFHSPRLCRAAVFLIQTNVSLMLSNHALNSTVCVASLPAVEESFAWADLVDNDL